MKFSREIELKGHIVDSGILAKVMDCVVEYNGDFETEEFNLGKPEDRPELCTHADLRRDAGTAYPDHQ